MLCVGILSLVNQDGLNRSSDSDRDRDSDAAVIVLSGLSICNLIIIVFFVNSVLNTLISYQRLIIQLNVVRHSSAVYCIQP